MLPLVAITLFLCKQTINSGVEQVAEAQANQKLLSLTAYPSLALLLIGDI